MNTIPQSPRTPTQRPEDIPVPQLVGSRRPAPSKISPLSREAEAKRALEHTAIKTPLAWCLSVLFLLTIFFVPVLQFAVKARQHEAALPSLNRSGHLVPEASELKRFESDLETESVAAGWVLPRAQNVLTRLGVGNEKAYLGRQGTLIYEPDLNYVAKRGFLAPSQLRARMQSATEGSAMVQPDPIPAIVQFKEQLAGRGITLVLLPTPLKTMLQPELLTARYQSLATPLQNPSYPEFMERLAQQHVLVCDPTSALFEAKRRSGEAPFLQTDTHWTPAAMQLTSEVLSAFIEQNVPLPEMQTDYSRHAASCSGNGDIAAMLKLPPQQSTYPPQTVSIEQVVTSSGQPWRTSPTADVLLLGDSFTNIYSRAALGWGSGAGLAEQLSFRLRRPIDVIAINAGGAYSTRRLLADEILRGRDRLAGKRVVIWQFAMRDLQSGDWKLLDLPTLPVNAVNQALVTRPAAPRSTAADPTTMARFRRALARKAAQAESARGQVLHGSDGWLFYLPDVYSVSSGGFLRNRRNSQIEALVNFKQQLARRGIEMMVMPIPAKPTIYPEKLGLGGIAVPSAPQNPSVAAYQRALQAQGITVFDPTEILLAQKRLTSAPLLMPTDSHWSFVAMENTAAHLAAQLKSQLPILPPVVYTRRPVQVKNITDLSMQLKPQRGNKQFVRVQQTVQQVQTPDGKPWKASPEADILVMGDSFVNIYSHGGYWGQSAGFAEQLSFYLQRPVDLIAKDRGAVNTNRRTLQRDMQQGRDRLAGKRLVIYEVASRYLMGNSWDIVQLPAGTGIAPTAIAASPSIKPQVPLTKQPAPLVNQWVRATIRARSDVPDPGTAPYPDLIMTLRLTNVQPIKTRRPASRLSKDILVYVWGMRNHTLTKAAAWKIGQSVTLQITPWQTVEEEYGSYSLSDLPGEDGTQLDDYWAVSDQVVLRPGEIGLSGRVVQMDEATRLLTLEAERFMLPSGKTSDITPSKRKSIRLTSETTFRGAEENKSLTASDLENRKVVVVGEDTGTGAALIARSVTVDTP